MEPRGRQRHEDEQTREKARKERELRQRPRRRSRWARDAEITRSVNAAVQDDRGPDG